MDIVSFEDLEVWKECRKFRNQISTTTEKFPKEEKYCLTDQIKRSSRSVTANIAEGYGRFHFQENAQFCRQARGSLTETLGHLICALDLGYINEVDLSSHRIQYEQCLKLLNGYIAYLIKSKTNQINK